MEKLILAALSLGCKGGCLRENIVQGCTFRRRRLSLDADPESGSLAVVHRDVEGQDLSLLPGELELVHLVLAAGHRSQLAL